MGVIELPYTRSVAEETDPIFRRVEHIIPPVEWPLHGPYVAAINRLKRERNAVILAHNYQVPEIFHTVADIVGDSLALAMQAAKTDADVIVLCGVAFYGGNRETSQSVQDRARARPARRMLARRVDHRRRRAAAARTLSRYADRHLREHVGRGQGRVRRLRDQRQRSADRRGAGRSARDLLTRRIPRQVRRLEDERGDRRLEGALRSPRALHRRRHPPVSRG